MEPEISNKTPNGKEKVDNLFSEDLVIAGPSSIQSVFSISPREIISLPKQTFIKSRKHIKRGIITDSPYNNDLEAEIKKRQEKEIKKKKRADLKKLVPKKNQAI